MSFMLTEEQFVDGSKDVTRRLGWWFLKAGDHVLAVRKAMGLRKGEKQVVLGEIEVVASDPEPLDTITQREVDREGFPHLSPAEFVEMFCGHMRCSPSTEVNRIEFRRVPFS